MKLLTELLNTLPSQQVPVRKIIIGVHWTLVSSTFCGLGSTLVGSDPHGHSKIRDVGALHEKSAQELANWMLSDNLLEASIGIAAFNSLQEVDENKIVQVNAVDVISKESIGKNLVIVGHFPFIDRVKNSASTCRVIEKRPFGDDFPEEAAGEFIPQADIIAITGTAFINHSIDRLLSLCRPGAKVMILGPSTPLAPLLFRYGISFLSGSRVQDEEAAINTIQQGATFQQVKGVRLVTMTND